MSKAIRYAAYGGPEVLTVDEVPTPEPGPGQVRVAVKAAGINSIDWKIRRGFMGGAPLEEPARTGLEFAGTIAALGSGVQGWSVDQAVFGRVPSGAAATDVLAEAGELLAKPSQISFEEAAALPVAVETAHRVLRLLDVGADQAVLIHAVAGGVGLAAAQLARARGAKVIGTASPVHHTFLRALGVRPVTYGDGLEDRVRETAPKGIDAVLDASGRDVLGVSVELAGSPDKVVTIADGRTAGEFGVRFSTGADQTMSLPEIFAEIGPLLERGALRMPIAKTFPLERIADAHRLSEQGHLRGKIVLSTGAAR